MMARAIPARCAGRPLTRGGLVVPYVSVVTGGGEDILLGEVHRTKAERCIYLRLCQICGGPLTVPLVVFATSTGLERCWSSEAPLHPECARYSAAACPMLAGKMPGYREGPGRAPGRPCDKPGCDCDGWVTDIDPSQFKARGAAEPWHAVWLDDFIPTVDGTTRRVNGVSWRGIEPRRIRPVAAPDAAL